MNDNFNTNEIFVDILEKNYESIKNDLFLISSEKGYFLPFRAEGVVPEKIVSDIFLKIIITSLRINDKSILKEQYVWTKDMLSSRGYGYELFLKNYLSYLEDLKQVMMRYSHEKYYLSISEFIDEYKKHFVETVGQ